MEMQKYLEDISVKSKVSEGSPKTKSDVLMTSSILSASSSLASPVDSGVQLLDSESEVTSLMSVSGIGCDSDPAGSGGNEGCEEKNSSLGNAIDSQVTKADERTPLIAESESNSLNLDHLCKEKLYPMTKSDIDNHNVHQFDPVADFKYRRIFSKPINSSVSQDVKDQNLSEELLQLEMVALEKEEENAAPKSDVDLCNISLNSYELLDYTLQNTSTNRNIIAAGLVDEMHVSMSEEVNESLKVVPKVQQPDHNIGICSEEIKQLQATNDDQIVFRRQRRKKSKSDTPKKRVSFHEDILNSTKIDDVHIEHGFVTRDPNFAVSFLDRGFVAKSDVAKGRYSWAAEGDTPFCKSTAPVREVNSDIYVHRPRFSSTSSSSSTSISSSIDEEDTGTSNSDDAFTMKKEPSQNKLPKSSCLKKTRSHKKYIDTNVVEEAKNIRKRKSENNLLESNIFGSLKSIFTFSTSVPLAERGVPEGQEDVNPHFSSETNIARTRRLSADFLTAKLTEGFEVTPTPVKQIDPRTLAKTNLKLTRSEGFYPNYPNNSNLPANIILCDSNVYEHKGISYSYEYEEFQKSLEKPEKPKSSSIYQMLVKELSFFKRKPKKDVEHDGRDNFEFVNATTPTNECVPEAVAVTATNTSSTNSLKKYASSATIDFSDNETISDVNENVHTRHLNSPKRKISKPNHYSVQSFKQDYFDEKSDCDSQMCAKSLNSMKVSKSKDCMITRFLKNVTVRKMIDLKLQKKRNNCNRYMDLYVKGAKVDESVNETLDVEIENEIINAKQKIMQYEEDREQLYAKIKNDAFRDYSEILIKVFPINSAYTVSGESKPLILTLSSSTMYISGLKPNSNYCNYFVLPYTDLNTVMIGPDSQTIHFSNYSNDMQCIIVTGSLALTEDVIGQLEVAMRRDANKPKLPAVKHLNMRDMVHLRRAICKQTAIMKEEEYYYYAIVNVQDHNVDLNEMPLGPSKEGPLMFKSTSSDSRWETAYFILKAGILYMLSSPSHRLPMRVLPLINGACQGAQRIYHCNRPHTFQIHVGALTLHLAAPDEYVASEWLQAIVHAASKTYTHKETNPTQSCSLLMTTDYILTVREAFAPTFISTFDYRNLRNPMQSPQLLSCASISDIIAFRLPSVEQSWCILEFACREVHESSGDWILYFATNVELERFISTLEMLWNYNDKEGKCFPISTIPETDCLSRRCMDTHQLLQCAWTSGQINLQSF